MKVSFLLTQNLSYKDTEMNKNICYFDTSALNAFHDDLEKDEILRKLLKNYNTYISTLNLIELWSTSDRKKRLSLSFFTRKLVANVKPLDLPNAILTTSLKAYNENKFEINWSIGQKQKGIWIALNKPKYLKGQEHKEISRFKRKEEKWYKKMHKKGREKFQKTIENYKHIRNSSQFLKFINGNFPTSFFLECFDACGFNKNLFLGKEQTIVRDLEPWLFYFGAMAIQIFNTSLRARSFGKRNNPGSIDVQQAIYLASCNNFITNDPDQYKLLRIISKLGHIKRNIFLYESFRRKILNSNLTLFAN